MTDRACKNCEYFEKEAFQNDFGFWINECHRYPRQVGGSGFPIVCEDEWCGEFKPKEFTPDYIEGDLEVVCDGKVIQPEIHCVPIELPDSWHEAFPDLSPISMRKINFELELDSKTREKFGEILDKLEALAEFGIDPNTPEARKFIFGSQK